jgi:glycosyltransferase involved in cell wall biosynthesis
VEAALYAAALHNQQGPLFAHVDRFIAVSEATARRLIELGLPKARTVSIANFVAAGAVASRSRAHEGEYALVAGRLVEEKGFDTAIRACRTAGVPLVVAGEGPDMNRLRQLAAGGEVKFAGWLAPDRLEAVRRRAAVVLAPSRWEEPCPYAVLDALAAGVPALVSERGGLPELAGEQSVVPAEDLERWTSALEAHWRAPAARRCRGEEALARVRERFSEDVFHDAVVSAYGGD